jgi:anti-anti-sigma factor
MFDVRRIQDISVVGVSGELSRRNVHVLEGVLESLANCEHRNVVLNFERLRHLDYKLVQRIAERIIEFQCDGGDIRMAAASGYVRRIIEAMGLDEEIFASVEDALLSFVGDIPEGDPQ